MRCILCFYLSILVVANTTAQDLHFINYTIKEGLISNSVYQTFQDTKGFIWFATEEGVSRFDGVRFENYSVADGLSSNEIISIYEDSKNRIWLFSYSGKISIYQNGKFTSTKSQALLNQLSLTDFPSGFYENKNTIYLCNSADGIFKIENENIEKLALANHPNLKAQLVWETPQNQLIVLTNEGYFDLITGKKIAPLFQELQGQLNTVLEDGSVIRYTAKGIVRFNGNKERLIIPTDAQLKKGNITKLMSDEQNNIGVSTGQGAIYYQKTENGWVLGDFEFSGHVVSNMFIDKNQNLWLSTLGEGVYYTPFHRVRTYNSRHGLKGNVVYTIAANKKQGLLLGLDGNQYGTFSAKEVFTPQTLQTTRSPRQRITSLFQDQNGATWLGGDHGIFKEINDKMALISNSSVKALLPTQDTLWVSISLGVLPIEFSLSTALSQQEIKKRLIHNKRTHAIAINCQGNLLLGTNQGLLIRANSSIEPYPISNQLLSKRITDIETTNECTIWFGTYGWGIGVIKDHEIIEINSKMGLTGDICKAIFVVNESVAWIATSSGLNKVLLHNDTVSIKQFTEQDGLPSNNINDVFVRDDTIWVASSEGLSFFEEENMNRLASPPKMVITQFGFGEKDTLVKDGYKINYDLNHITIKYVGISYESRGKVQYEYKLEGIDSAWTRSQSTIVEYPSLPPGNYNFMVKAANADGVWSSKPATISFSIAKPFYKEWWFITLEGLALLIVVYGSFLLVSRRTREREQRKAAFSLQLAEAEKKALRAQMNPHFIFNSLNTIQRFIVKNDKKQAYEYLESFGSLIRKILEQSREKYIKLEEELNALELYISLESRRFSGKFTYTIKVANDIEKSNILIPPMLIQPVLENAIIHGIVPLEKAGIITIALSLNNETLHCIIEDNGIGRSRAAEMQERKTKHKSLATEIIHERMELLNMDQDQKYATETVDLKNEKGEAMGTKVVLSIPFKSSY